MPSPSRITLRFGDHLHVGIFDAVVDRLDEMPSAPGAQIAQQGSPLNLAAMAVSTASALFHWASDPPTMIEGRAARPPHHRHPDAEERSRAVEFGKAAHGIW